MRLASALPARVGAPMPNALRRVKAYFNRRDMCYKRTIDYNTVMNNQRKRGFFYCIKPILFYFLINIGVSIVFAFVVEFSLVKSGADLSDVQTLYDAVLEFTLKYSIWLSLAVAVIAGAIFYLPYRRSEWQIYERPYINKIGIKDILLLLLTGIAVYMFVDVVLVILSGLFNMNALLTEHSESLAYITGDNIILDILVYCLITPAVEELIFRGLVFNRLRGSINAQSAMIMSAVIFGAMHMGGIIQIAYAAFLGWVMAYVYCKYCNLAAPAIIHITFNLMNYVFAIPALTAFFNGENSIGNIVYYALTVALCVAAFKLMKNKRNAEKRPAFGADASGETKTNIQE